MRRYDGRLVRVSQFLGTGFRATFLSRYCIPEFDSGFNGVPPPVEVPGRQLLDQDQDVSASTGRDELTVLRRNRGYYRLRYAVEPRVAVDPSAYVRRLSNEGPYDIAHMWGTDRFHSSVL